MWQWPGLTIAAVLPSQDCWCVSHRRHGLQWEFLRPWRSPKMVIGNIKIKGSGTEEELRTGSWFFNRITQSQSQVPWIDLAPCPPMFHPPKLGSTQSMQSSPTHISTPHPHPNNKYTPGNWHILPVEKENHLPNHLGKGHVNQRKMEMNHSTSPLAWYIQRRSISQSAL